MDIEKPIIRDTKMLHTALLLQKTEITEHRVYTKLAEICSDAHNAEVLRSVGKAENAHAAFWQERTGAVVQPDNFKVFWTVLLARTVGLTFVLKRMEKNEGTASKNYASLLEKYPELDKLSADEAVHEKQLLAMLDEERLRYVGSIVLGLNDALVELTGSLAGFTLALGGTKIISLAGLVTGISAAFSMAASGYLSSKADGEPHAAKSALYTGSAYIITVALLILPFLLLDNKFIALGITLSVAVFIIFIFNYYISVAKDLDFKRRFGEMAIISLSVAAISFGIGWALNRALGV